MLQSKVASFCAHQVPRMPRKDVQLLVTKENKQTVKEAQKSEKPTSQNPSRQNLAKKNFLMPQSNFQYDISNHLNLDSVINVPTQIEFSPFMNKEYQEFKALKSS